MRGEEPWSKEWAGTVWRRVCRAMAVLVLSWTALAMLWTMVPPESATRRATRGLFERYRQLSGLDQHWDMFATAPYHHAYEVTIEVEPPGSNGTRVTTGPVLPGLEGFPPYFRYHTFFSRLEEKTYASWLQPYAGRLAAELAREHPDWQGGTFRIRKAAERIQSLETIRDLGEIAFEQTTLHGPYPIPSVGDAKISGQ
jgi:hypothetical protein